MEFDMNEEPNDGGSAFPAMLPGGNYCTPGMTLRDWFAGQALLMIPHHGCGADLDVEDVAHAAYQFSDAMLAAREPKPDTTTSQHIALGIGGGK